MSDFKIKIEEDTFWREIKKENIEGDAHCPSCRTLLIIIPLPSISFAYCPNCKKYYELMKKCRKCGAEYSVSEIHFCNSYSLIDKK